MLEMCGGSESPLLLLRCRLMLQQTEKGRSWIRLGLASSNRDPLTHHADPPSQVQIHTLLATSKMLSNTPSCLPSFLIVHPRASYSYAGRHVEPYICYRRGCGLELARFMFLVLPIRILPKRYTNRICEGHEPAAQWYWRPLNRKRSLPVLKWTESESGYFFWQNL